MTTARQSCAAIAAGAVVLSALTPSCAAPGSALRTLDARTLRASLEAPSAPSIAMRATYFPSTAPRARRRPVPLVVVEPILFRRELLYSNGAGASGAEGGGILPYLSAEGFSIWLVGVGDSALPDPQTLGRGVVQTVDAIARATGVARFDLVGLSLGAEGALDALAAFTAPGSPVAIRRVAFVGGGFDHAYAHSFAAETALLRGGPASALCTLDGDVGCARAFHRPSAATPWLAALPAADGDALAPARERFPFVSHFTRLPVLFVNGKADGIAPSESMFPLYTLWGSDEPDPRAVPKLLFLAGRENGLGLDFDDFDLFAGSHAERLWAHLAQWLARAD